ncbi:MAG: OmpH family outer membrane protein [Bacteroidales bacterium]|nr:OmpH family outer membrane protein [Bacteroidales bacterium]
MRKIYLFLLSMVAVAMLVSCGDKETTKAKQAETPVSNLSSDDPMKAVAIVDLDSIMANYQFAIEANDELMSEAENARVNLNQKARALENKMAEFQKKVDNNAFLSQDRARSEAEKLQREQQSLEEQSNQLGMKLQDKQLDLSAQLQDSVDNAIKLLNTDGKYALVLSKSALSGNILYSDPALDITNQLIDLLNERYSKK